jgi:adenine phosphoribosyltransferase
VDLASKIRDIPDFPKRGIVFKDIMPLLADPDGLHETVEKLAEFAEPRKPDLILGAEARGFILGAALAYRLHCGFIASRKPGKLPWRTVSVKYAL